MSGRTLRAPGALLLLLGLVAYAIFAWSFGPPPADINVRWADEVDADTRSTLEARYGLVDGSLIEDQGWRYTLRDTTPAHIRALVEDPAVADTHRIDRRRFTVEAEATRRHTPPSSYPRLTVATRVAAATGLLVGLGLLLLSLGPIPDASTSSAPSALTRQQRVLYLALLGSALVISVASERHVHVTVDEPNHLRYGQGILRLDSDRFDDSKMPVSALNAVPGAIATRLPDGRLRTHLNSLHAARYPTILFSLLVAACVFAWARRLYGASGGLLALALYVFDPNLLAHGQLATTDLYAAGTTLFAVYSFWRFLSEGGARRAVVAGLALGLAQVAKYSLVLLFPILALTAAVYHARTIRDAVARRQWAWTRRAVACSAAFVAISLFVINAAFLFNGTFTPLDQYELDSDAVASIRSAMGPLSRLPLPFPVPYLQGLDMVIDHERTGASFGRLYLLGELREGGSLFPGYYLYASLYKTPLPSLLLLGAAAVALLRRRTGASLADEACVLLPLVSLSVYFNLFNRSQIGIRYILIVFPLAYVLCGSILSAATVRSKRWYAAAAAATAALVLSVASYYPFYLPYFNELVGRRIDGYHLLADSNLDWGQYGYELERYRANHPDAAMEPAGPTAGTVLVRVNRLVGVIGNLDDYAWLRDHFNPVDHIGYGVLVYHIEPRELEALGLRR